MKARPCSRRNTAAASSLELSKVTVPAIRQRICVDAAQCVEAAEKWRRAWHEHMTPCRWFGAACST
jgi:hypothetical protein